MNWYKQSKLSDYKGLLDKAINKLDNVIDRVYPEGSFSFFFEDDNNKKVKVFIRLGENLISQVVPKGSDYYKITICTLGANRDDVYRVLAHEITHISQRYNGFSRYEFDEIKGLYTKLKDRGVKNPNWELIKELRHGDSPTEHEAKLVGLLTLLKRGNIELAAESLYQEPEYYDFSNKKFLQSIYYFGIPIESYRELRNLINNEVDFRYSLYKSKKISLGTLQDFVHSIYPVLNMLNLGRKGKKPPSFREG